MKTIKIFYYISLLLLISCTHVNENTNSVTTIPFQLTPNGHIVVDATVNGHQGKFIFDTGAGVNLLTKSFAESITTLTNTNHFYAGHRATGEVLVVDLWQAASFDLESFKSINEIFAVYDIKFPLDGLISLTAFKDHAVTIDFKNKNLTIESPESLQQRLSTKKFSIPLNVSNDRDIKLSIFTPILLNNKHTLNVNLDSGAGFDVYRFNSKYMSVLNIDKHSIKSEYRPSFFKPETGNQYFYSPIKKLSDISGSTTVENLNATFIDGLIYEGIMSINWIGDIITIDIPNKRIVVNN